jgi:metal-responsive CopG/Arc/MetJ family transcriptional regulator
MVRMQVQLTEKQVEGLRRIAERDKVSISEVVRRSVEHTLAHAHVVVDREELKRRALELVGIANSGLSDIGENHDKYLAEDFLK